MSIRSARAVPWLALLLAVSVLSACSGGSPRGGSIRWAIRAPERVVGMSKLRHVVIIMQENRSFDSYFGTYPGADGIPRKHGHFTVCAPDPLRHTCQLPYHDPHL